LLSDSVKREKKPREQGWFRVRRILENGATSFPGLLISFTVKDRLSKRREEALGMWLVSLYLFMAGSRKEEALGRRYTFRFLYIFLKTSFPGLQLFF